MPPPASSIFRSMAGLSRTASLASPCQARYKVK